MDFKEVQVLISEGRLFSGPGATFMQEQYIFDATPNVKGRTLRRMPQSSCEIEAMRHHKSLTIKYFLVARVFPVRKRRERV